MHESDFRKAAILLASLPHDVADAMLAQMGPTEARQIRRAAVSLGEITSEERDAVLEEFSSLQVAADIRQDTYAPAYASAPTPDSIVEKEQLVPDRFVAGIELDRCDGVGNSEPPPSVAGPLSAQSEEELFGFLEHVDADHLVPYLENEHPQTICLVLSHVAPQQAADVLEQFSHERRVEVIQRLARLDLTDAHTVHEVADSLKGWMESRAWGGNRQAGLSAAEQILNASRDEVKDEILSSLESRDRSTAAHLRKKTETMQTSIPAAEIQEAIVEPNVDPIASPPARPLAVYISEHPASVAAALEMLEPDTALLAFSGIDPTQVQSVLRHLSRASARRWKKQLRSVGPVRLSDVEASQREFALATEAMLCVSESGEASSRRVNLAA